MDQATQLRAIEDKLLETDPNDVSTVELLKSEHARVRASSPLAQSASVAPMGAAGAPDRGGSSGALPDASTPATALRGTAQVAGSALKHLLTFGMLPGEAVKYGVDKLSGDEPDFGRATRMMTDAIDNFTGVPQTKTGQTGVNILGGGAAAALMPGSAVRNIASAMAGETGGEVGGQIGGNYGRIIGSLLAGGAASLPQSKADALSRAISTISKPEMDAALRMADSAKAQGLTLTPEQLFPNQPGMTDLFNSVLAKAKTGNLRSIVNRQPDEALVAMNAGGNKLGVNPGAPAATRDLRLAAEGAVGDMGTTPATSKLFEGNNPQVPGDALDALHSKLNDLADAYKASPETVTRIRSLQANLNNVSEKQTFPFGSSTGTVPGRPGGAAKRLQVQIPNNVEVNLGASSTDVDTVVKEAKALLSDLSLTTPATTRRITGKVSDSIGEVSDLLDKLIPTRPQGRDIYASMAGRREDLTSSLVGRLAKKGVSPGDPDSLGLLQSTLGSPNLQTSDIAQLTGALRDRYMKSTIAGDTEAAAQATRALPQASRVLWDNAVGQATRDIGGLPTHDAGAKLADVLIGTPAKEANFRQTMQGVGASLGQKPQDFQNGMVELLRVLEAQGRNRASAVMPAAEPPSAMSKLGNAVSNPYGAAAMGLGHGVVGAAITGARVAKAGFGIASDAINQGTMNRLDTFLADPNAVKAISELGRTPIASNRAQALVAALMATANQPSEGAK